MDRQSSARNMPRRAAPHDPVALHRLLVDRVQDYAIFALDAEGYILTWNRGAQRLKGYTAQEAIGMHFSAFYPAEDLATRKPARELEIATETGRVEDEGWRLRKDGTRFWANVLITALRDEDGVLVGFAKVTRDLTERRDAVERALEGARRLAMEEARSAAAEENAQELRQLAKQLQDQATELKRQSQEATVANQVKSEFLAAMSHELRTPLNAIGGYTQLLQMGVSGPITDDQRDHLERIQRSQQHLMSVINDILNFSRIEAGQVAYEMMRVNMQDIVKSVIPMTEPQIREKQLTLRVTPCACDHAAMADRLKVEQILLNLLSNAVKFTPEGGQIEVTCGSANSHVSLRVSDTGVGIAPEHLESIFEPFMQVGRALASPKEGTGLGLAISRDLARAMEGDLTAESREGIGSTFTLTLPAAS